MSELVLRLVLAVILGPAFVPATPAGQAFAADFTQQPYGPPQDPRVVLYDNTRGESVAHPLTVIDGGLQTQATEGLSAAYAQVDVGAPVTRIGAEFEFTGGTKRGGAIALPVWADSFDATWPQVPDSPSHVVLTDDWWEYGVYQDGQLAKVTWGRFAPPLPSDTPLRLDINLIGDTAALTLPDGTTTAVTDPRITTPGRYATFESFQWDAANMARARMLRVWADMSHQQEG